MAFSTIQGSGGAPDSFVGTTGVDAIAVANSTGNFFLGGNTGADNVQILNSGAASYSDVLATATVRGGAGADTMTLGNATATIFTGLFANGGAGADTMTSNAANSFIASTIQGGKANDTLTFGIVTSSKVNGNLGDDTVSVDGVTSASSVYGGAGNDTINAGTAAFTSSLISGDKGNDTITLEGTNTSIDDLTIKGGDGVDTIDVSDNGATTDEGIYVAGNDGSDTITGSDNAVTAITLAGGAGDDTITSGAGSTTAIGGLGRDTMQAGAGTNTFQYTSKAQAGVASSATSTAALGLADVIGSTTAFTVGTDKFSFVGDTLVGSSGSVATGAANAWNLNTAGVFVSTGQLAWTAGTTTAATVAAAIGTVVGTAGDKAYFVIEDNTTDTNTLIFQLTLGTTRTTTGALNAGDTIALVADVTGSDELATGDFVFS